MVACVCVQPQPIKFAGCVMHVIVCIAYLCATPEWVFVFALAEGLCYCFFAHTFVDRI